MKHIIYITTCASLAFVLVLGLTFVLVLGLAFVLVQAWHFVKIAQSQGVFIVLNQEIQWLCA